MLLLKYRLIVVISKFNLRYIKERTVAPVEIVIHIFHILYFRNEIS